MKIIRGFDNVIENTLVRVDISEIKEKIIAAINLNMSKIGRASEEVLQGLLSIGQT